MTAKKATAIRFFASDLDGTLLGKLDASRAFRETWLGLPDKKRPA